MFAIQTSKRSKDMDPCNTVLMHFHCRYWRLQVTTWIAKTTKHVPTPVALNDRAGFNAQLHRFGVIGNPKVFPQQVEFQLIVPQCTLHVLVREIRQTAVVFQLHGGLVPERTGKKNRKEASKKPRKKRGKPQSN